MKIMCITSSYPVHPRLKKIGESLGRLKSKNGKFDTTYVAWDRLSLDNKNDDFVYKSKEGYDNRFKKLLGLINFSIFVKKKKKEFNPDIIVCRFFDMALIGAIFCKNITLIYDVNDIPDDKNLWITMVYRFLERFILKKATLVILSSRFFIDKYKYASKKIVILENKPEKSAYGPGIYPFLKTRFTLSYIGVIRFKEILENLIHAVKDKNLDLLFFGYGPDDTAMKRMISEEKIQNVHFFGRYDYKKIHQLYNISDLVWASYPNNTVNEKRAISNKFFESLIFKKPCVFSKGSFLGELAVEEDIGFVVDPFSSQDISSFFDNIIDNKNQMIEKIENIEKYSNQTNLYWDIESVSSTILSII